MPIVFEDGQAEKNFTGAVLGKAAVSRSQLALAAKEVRARTDDAVTQVVLDGFLEVQLFGLGHHASPSFGSVFSSPMSSKIMALLSSSCAAVALSGAA